MLVPAGWTQQSPGCYPADLLLISCCLPEVPDHTLFPLNHLFFFKTNTILFIQAQIPEAAFIFIIFSCLCPNSDATGNTIPPQQLLSKQLFSAPLPCAHSAWSPFCLPLGILVRKVLSKALGLLMEAKIAHRALKNSSSETTFSRAHLFFYSMRKSFLEVLL